VAAGALSPRPMRIALEMQPGAYPAGSRLVCVAASSAPELPSPEQDPQPWAALPSAGQAIACPDR
jgi:hypothetical protein